MPHCSRCQREVEAEFRFCPWCAAPQRRKLVEFFPASAVNPRDRGKSLRVSVYLDENEQHARFSVWNESGEAEAAVSLDPDEAQRLGQFVLDMHPLAREDDTAETDVLPNIEAGEPST